jgi:hypothetical protein
MGLNIEGAIKGLFFHSDRYGTVVYRLLTTGFLPGEDEIYVHPTDNDFVPVVAVYTSPPDSEDYKYCGNVSNIYRFVGNDILNQQIRDSVQSIGLPIIEENTLMSYDLTRMRNEIAIQSSKNVLQVGDVIPVMVVNNSYDGTKAASVAFAISLDYDGESLSFAFKLGEMRMVHIESASTTMSSAIGAYMGAFSENIVDLISNNFEQRVTEEQLFATLDLVDTVGKRRKEAISKLIDDMQGGASGLPTLWEMFVAIVRYSSLEQNLNAKKMLESAAESVLVIPARMYEVLSRLESGQTD